jgi:hypothetical protein
LRGDLVHVAGDKTLQEAARILTGDPQEAAIVEKG